MSVDAGGTTIYPETPGASIEWFKPGVPVPAWDDEEVTHGIVLYAEENTTINTYVVPKLTSDQVVQAYNSIIIGKPVTIADAEETFYLTVEEADNMNDEVAIIVLYFDTMILTYHDNGTITYKEIG